MMVGAATPSGLGWRHARVMELVEESARARSIVLDVAGWLGHLAGQHVDVRRAAPCADRTQRSYSIASAPEDGYLVLTVERLDGAKLSPYLVDALVPGDDLELRGPIGNRFVWEDSPHAPVLLVASDTGIVPFRSMLRHCVATNCTTAIRLLYCAESIGDLIYHDELLRLAAYHEIDIRISLRREWPSGWRGHRGPIDRELLRDLAWSPAQRPLNYVCGPAGFVDGIAIALAESGHHSTRVRTERFEPTGSVAHG
jgi:ferredoxin-NADP reductase